MNKQAADLTQWDVITFRRSNERKFKTGFIWHIYEESFAGFTSQFATVQLDGKKELIQLNGSTEWKFLGSMNPEAA